MDAEDLNSWGVKYLMYEDCGTESSSYKDRFRNMRVAIERANYGIFLANRVAHNHDGFSSNFGNSLTCGATPEDNFGWVEFQVNANSKYTDQAGPGAWVDFDLLQVGKPGLSVEEEKTHFALWAMFKSPLFL
jgi:alpha-galactosidase